MKEITIRTYIRVSDFNELSENDAQLIEAAKMATNHSYAPYSKFSVGAAVRLSDETIVSGNNQENAAYPSGLCAERVALFYANAQHPELSVNAIAIAARNEQGEFTKIPVSPCGACRQVLIESEKRFKHPIRILLFGTEEIYEIACVKDLLPLTFEI